MIRTWIFSKCSRKMRLTGEITWRKLERSTTDCKFHRRAKTFRATRLAKLAVYHADGGDCSPFSTPDLHVITHDNAILVSWCSSHLTCASGCVLCMLSLTLVIVLLLSCSFEPEELLYSYIMRLCRLSRLFCAVTFWKYTFFFFFSKFLAIFLSH